MASILKVDDLRGNTAAGNITITSEGGSATMQLQQGVAKAWNNFNGTGTVAIRGSFGVSSIGDTGTGRYDTNLTNALSSTDDAAAGGHAGKSSAIYIAAVRNGFQTTTKYNQYTGNTSGSGTDVDFVFVTIHGDLA